MTDQEIKQEEDEIKASVANLEVEKTNEQKIKANRLPKEIEELQQNPIDGVKLVHHDECTIKIFI